ncbi:MAG TPA: HAD hydrolase family protein [Oscillospiraceae bacterium]|nr:HAD hydrolase family protein [Oscillospiraceae bacterium]HPK36583.1 HAD hydrolase family protein [Oscillospiraceae bacterium]HPR76799.1 HAD hydrolase family protein [Oscillospiraceae bacterium]
MKYKLLVFDLDDTLLRSDKTISDVSADAIRRCAQAGIKIAYITARSPRKVGLFLKDLPCDALALYNGALIYIGGDLIGKNVISFSAGMEVIKKVLVRYPKTGCGIYLEPYSYLKGSLKNIATGEIVPCAPEQLPECDIQRIRLIFDEYDSYDIFDCIGPEMNLFPSPNAALITHKDADKLNALRKITGKLGIDLKQTIAFGDSDIDVEMLKGAGIGVAVENALPEAKAAADEICDTNDNDGVAKWVIKNLL